MYESIVPGAALTAACIVVAHLLCWSRTLSLTKRYAIGTACIGAGVALTAWRLDEWLIFWTFAAMALAAGLTTAGLHEWRAHRGELAGEQRSLVRAGRIIRRARDGDGAA